MPKLRLAATATKAEKGLKREADDAAESPTKKMKTLVRSQAPSEYHLCEICTDSDQVDGIEAERIAWVKEKAKMQTELDINKAQREALTRDKAALQSENKTLSDKIQNLEKLASDQDLYYSCWNETCIELKSLKTVLAKQKKASEQLEMALINYRKIQDMVKNTQTTTED